jgi:hypothetical protein
MRRCGRSPFNHRKALSAAVLSVLLVLASAGIIYQAAGLQQEYLSDNTPKPIAINSLDQTFNVSSLNATSSFSIACANMTSNYNLSEAPALTAAGWSTISLNQTSVIGQRP